MRVTSLAVLVMVFLSTIAGVAASKALVIGNDAYAGHALQNARSDASAIAARLKAMGYKVSMQLDLASDAMNEAINTFASSLDAGDTAVFYYAGHGFQLNGENYLVPIDFVIGDPQQATERGYPLYSLLKRFTEHGARTQIIILDACRDNPFLETRSVTKGWSALSASAGTFLAFGTSPGSTANDDPQESHGLFTKFLLMHLDDASSGIEEMFKNVRRDVISASGGSQVPWTESSLIGSVSLSIPGVESSGESRGEETTDRQVPPVVGQRARSLGAGGQVVLRDVVRASDSEAVTSQSLHFIQKAQEEMRLGKLQDSISTLRRGLSLFPTCLKILKMLGIALAIAGRNVEAEHSLDQAFAVEPQDNMIRVYKCIVLTGGEVGTAKDECGQAVTLDPGSGAAHLAMADFLLSTGQPVRALAEATTALDIQPKCSMAFAVRGEIFKSMGERDSARNDFEEAAKLATLE